MFNERNPLWRGQNDFLNSQRVSFNMFILVSYKNIELICFVIILLSKVCMKHFLKTKQVDKSIFMFGLFV